MDYELKSGNILRVIQDESPESPRECDNLGKMICCHGNYSLGDKRVNGKGAQMLEIARDLNILEYIIGLDPAYFYDSDKLEEFINAKEGAVVIKLFLFEHGSVTIRMYQASCKWDSSMVGYIYVSKERIIEEYGDASEESVEKARSVLESEVKTYAQYLEGDIYGFKIIKKETCSLGHEHEDVIDSCWGFYGDDPDKNGMLDHIDDELLILELA